MSAGAVVLSAIFHLGLLTVAVVAATVWKAEQPRVYIVNLVPAVAAVGTPTGRAKVAAPAPSRVEPAPRAARFTPKTEPAAKEPAPKAPAIKEPPPKEPAPREQPPSEPAVKAHPPETVSIPAPPEVAPREAPRPPAPRETAALPEPPASREIALPANARPKPLKAPVPALPSQRVAIRAADEERSLPRPLADLRNDPPPRPVKLAPAEALPRKLVLRDLPVDGPRRTEALPVPKTATDVPALSSPTTPSRQVALPKPGQKDLPNITSPPPPPLPVARPPAPAPVPAPVAVKAVPAIQPPPAPAPAPPAPAGRPDGSAQGSGAITMTVSDFPFAWYLQTVQRKVNEKWTPPMRAEEGRAVVVFDIGRNGEVRRPAVENTSGDAAYDQAALRAITEANPFPPLPAEFKESALRIHLGFNFGDRG